VEGTLVDVTLEAFSARLEGLETRVRQLESRVRELEQAGSEFRLALNRLGDALAATHDRPAMLRAVLEICALYLRASAAVFYGTMGGSGRLRPLATSTHHPADELGELAAGEGVAGTAASTGSVVLWPGATAPSRQELAIALGEATEAAPTTAVAVPVRSGGREFGVLALYGRSVDRPFTEDDVDSLSALARQVETAIENTFLYEEATRLSITDGLTSLWNRRQFDLRLTAEVQRAIRFGESFSLVLLDLDDFKPINDRFGHQAGDAALIEVAHRLSSAIRDVDLVARFGGDEFGLILPNTGLAGALRLADKVLGVVANAPMEFDGSVLTLAASAGVASYPEHGRNRQELVAAADTALYRAKRAGGGRVEHAKVGG
jgi:two-component system cell cycle response regulator